MMLDRNGILKMILSVKEFVDTQETRMRWSQKNVSARALVYNINTSESEKVTNAE